LTGFVTGAISDRLTLRVRIQVECDL